MSPVRRREAGFTLIEVLMAASIMIVILTASLTVFETFVKSSARNARQNDAQEVARRTMVVLSRQLRNLAGPTDDVPQTFDKMTGNDLVFQTVNPVGPAPGQNASNVQRVRYCLDTGTPQKLWRQVQTWSSATPPSPPSTVNCPDGSWGNQRMVANWVVNGASRPAFAFNSIDPTAVSEVRTDLYVDPDVKRPPDATRLQSGVFLRNQNRPPVASLQATPGNKGHVVLNASTSTDPEGRTLTFSWEDSGTKLTSSAAVWDYQTTSGPHTIKVLVRDPGGLTTAASTQVTVP